jgi:catechol 2,3-dioxygenase-like lactoylglutathione lyase family enzyme
MTVDDLELVYQHLSVIGNQQTMQDISQPSIDIIAPPQIMPWGQKILFLADPDGNLIEIVQR